MGNNDKSVDNIIDLLRIYLQNEFEPSGRNFDDRIRDACEKWRMDNVSKHPELVYLFIEKKHLYNGRPLGELTMPFFGAAACPDAALIIPGKPKVAIEFDRGPTGSKLRLALAKASFSVLQKNNGSECDRAVVFFFIEKSQAKKPMFIWTEDTQKNIMENKIIDMFKRKPFNTDVLFIYDREG